jgi:ABC-type lipoprotein release transport system permease subunit
MALGATQRNVLRGVLVQGMKLAGAGLLIGIVAALLGSRLLAGLLFSIRATDAITFAAVSLVLAAMALLASHLPAPRASRVVRSWRCATSNRQLVGANCQTGRSEAAFDL